jgi:hypothetical protein
VGAAPHPPVHKLVVNAVFQAFYWVFSNPLGLPDVPDGIALVVFIIGCIAFLKKGNPILLGITAPFIITILWPRSISIHFDNGWFYSLYLWQF